MSEQNIETALRHLKAALALLEKSQSKKEEESNWFRATGHLTVEGIKHLNSLFASGKSTYAIAKEMGISHRSAALRRKRSRRRAVL